MRSKTAVLSLSDRCRNILTANWQGHLNTIKADSKGSKEDIYTSKVRYLFKRGKPYIWVQEGDMHNTNTIIDERASLSISSVVPGPLAGLLKSLKKFPARVALAGDIRPLKDDKVQNVVESLAEYVVSEHKATTLASYPVSAILSSASGSCRFKSENLQEILHKSSNYNIYKFNIRSCTYIDGSGGTRDVELDDAEVSKTDMLLPFSEKIIDGINQNEAGRRGLMLFCLEYFRETARDAFMLSIDHKGFDVLAKVVEAIRSNSVSHQWKEFRFAFKEEVHDIEAFCRMLVQLEEEALQSVKAYSGLC